MLKKGVKLFLIVICMITIFMFSSDDATKSTKKSDGVIIQVSNFLVGTKLSKAQQEKIIDYFVVPVRKSAHFLIYMLLGMLLISFIYEFSFSNKRMFFLAIFLAFLYACSDEIHQLFVPGRSGQISDVLLDTVGASVGVLVYMFILKFLTKRHSDNESDGRNL